MRYAKLERAALFGHSQAPFYALVACEKWNVEEARTWWVYATTQTQVASLEVSAHTISKEEARERTYTRMLPVVRQMVAARDAGATGNDLPKNTQNCWKYNRPCPHLERCNPNNYKDQVMSFLDSLKAEQAATAPTPPTGGGLFADPNAGVTAALPASTTPATSPADPGDDEPNAPVNPPEGEGGGRGKGTRGKGEKGATKLSDADIDALAERVCDKLAARMMRGLK